MNADPVVVLQAKFDKTELAGRQAEAPDPDASERLYGEADAVYEEIACTVPHSEAGGLALLKHISERSDGNYRPLCWSVVPACVTYLEAGLARGVRGPDIRPLRNAARMLADAARLNGEAGYNSDGIRTAALSLVAWLSPRLVGAKTWSGSVTPLLTETRELLGSLTITITDNELRPCDAFPDRRCSGTRQPQGRAYSGRRGGVC